MMSLVGDYVSTRERAGEFDTDRIRKPRPLGSFRGWTGRSTRPAKENALGTGKAGLELSAPVTKAILSALSERDQVVAICRDKDGNPEADPEFRDTESVPV